MRTSTKAYYTVLGIAPCKKGFGFAVLESRGLLVSWGVGRLHSKHDDEFLQRVYVLIAKYRVALLCLEDLSPTSRLGKRARRLIELARSAARTQRVGQSCISRSTVAQQIGLSGRAKKYDIALRLVELFPELGDVLPLPRRPWQTEDVRIALFLATALGVAHLPPR